MEKYCVRSKQNKLILVSTCNICGKKKSSFIKSHKISGLLSKLGIRTPLSHIQLIGDILF